MRWSIKCCPKLVSYADERLLFEETVVALVDCLCPLPAETRLLVTEDDVEAIVRAIFAGSGY